MKNYLLAAFAVLLALTSCSGLSDRAKEMVGDYYIPAISAEEPLMELNGNGKCVIHAVREGALSYQVPGKWNVVGDSLILDLKPEKLTFEGDSTLIGTLPSHISKYVVAYDGSRLTLKSEGVDYVYERRGHVDD